MVPLSISADQMGSLEGPVWDDAAVAVAARLDAMAADDPALAEADRPGAAEQAVADGRPHGFRSVDDFTALAAARIRHGARLPEDRLLADCRLNPGERVAVMVDLAQAPAPEALPAGPVPEAPPR